MQKLKLHIDAWRRWCVVCGPSYGKWYKLRVLLGLTVSPTFTTVRYMFELRNEMLQALKNIHVR